MTESPDHSPEVQHQWVKDQLDELQAEIADGLNKEEVTRILTDKQNDPFSENSAQTALAAQVALKMLKFNPGKLDGVIGGGTKGATRAFQESWNTENPEDRIAEDGELGPITISKLITKLGGTAPALAEKAKSTAEQIDYSPLNSLFVGVKGLKVENIKWGGEEKYIAQSVSKNGQHLFEVYYSNEEGNKGWYYMRFTSADQTFGISLYDTEEATSNWLSKEQVQAAIQKTQDVATEEVEASKQSSIDQFMRVADLGAPTVEENNGSTYLRYEKYKNVSFKIHEDGKFHVFVAGGDELVDEREASEIGKEIDAFKRGIALVDGSVMKQLNPDWGYWDKSEPFEHSGVFGIQFNTTVPLDADRDIPNELLPYPDDGVASFRYLKTLYEALN